MNNLLFSYENILKIISLCPFSKYGKLRAKLFAKISTKCTQVVPNSRNYYVFYWRRVLFKHDIILIMVMLLEMYTSLENTSMMCFRSKTDLSKTKRETPIFSIDWIIYVLNKLSYNSICLIRRCPSCKRLLVDFLVINFKMTKKGCSSTRNSCQLL